MRMTLDQEESQTMSDLKNQHLKKFGLKALVLIPIALLGWLLGMNSPMGAGIPVIIFVGGVVVLAIDGILRYRTEKRTAHG